MAIPARYIPLSTERPNRNTNAAILRFLMEIWDVEPEAYTFLGTLRGQSWRTYRIKGQRDRKIINILEKYPSDQFNLYFCPNGFVEPSRKAQFALPTRYAWADIDGADPRGYRPTPNILWETSPSRFQGLWLWDTVSPGHIAQERSRALVTNYGGDMTGWNVTKMLRIPGTINHKPERQMAAVRLLRFNGKAKSIPSHLPSKVTQTRRRSCEPCLRIDPYRFDPDVVMQKYRRKMCLYARSMMTANRVWRERSGAVFLIIWELMKAGAGDDEIAAVLSVNPHFNDKWGDDLHELERQICAIRAEWEEGQ